MSAPMTTPTRISTRCRRARGSPEESAEEHSSAKKGFFPSSCGVSTLVAAEAASLKVRVRWGDYQYERAEKDDEADGGDRQRRVPVWQRIPRERKLEVRFGPRSELPVVIPVPESGGLELRMLVRAVASRRT